MNFKKDYISDELKEMFTTVLTTKDREDVANLLNYSASTVHNIVYQNTMVSKRTRIIVQELLKLSKTKIAKNSQNFKNMSERIKKEQKNYD